MSPHGVPPEPRSLDDRDADRHLTVARLVTRVALAEPLYDLLAQPPSMSAAPEVAVGTHLGQRPVLHAVAERSTSAPFLVKDTGHHTEATRAAPRDLQPEELIPRISPGVGRGRVGRTASVRAPLDQLTASLPGIAELPFLERTLFSTRTRQARFSCRPSDPSPAA